jgi:chromosome segregation ATPase
MNQMLYKNLDFVTNVLQIKQHIITLNDAGQEATNNINGLKTELKECSLIKAKFDESNLLFNQLTGWQGKKAVTDEQYECISAKISELEEQIKVLESSKDSQPYGYFIRSY